MKKRTRERGWTFIETLIVIAIILILSGTAGFIGFRYVDRARVASARNQIEVYSLAINAYLFDTGRVPTQDQGLRALWEKPILDPVPSGWDGPYLTKPVDTDPWGTPYEYRVPGPNNLPFEIISYGADGMSGGEGNDEDISSWQQ